MKTNSKGDKPLATTKKQKLVGATTAFIATKEPGVYEEVPMAMFEVEDRDFNFHKVWLRNLVMSLDDICNQRLKLAFWILDNLNRENQLVMTQRAIAEKSGMSIKTVTRTMKALQSGNPAFLQKINSGAYRVNPNVIWKGSYSNRMGVMFQYGQTAAANKAADKADEEEQPEQTEREEEYEPSEEYADTERLAI